MVMAVTFAVEVSEYVAVTVNCCVPAICKRGLIGVMAIDNKVAGVTVSVVLPLMLPKDAVMTEVPAVTPVASAPAVMVATAGVADVQVEMAVMLLVVPLE